MQRNDLTQAAIKIGFAMMAILGLLLAVCLNFTCADLCEKYCHDVYGVDVFYRLGDCRCVFDNMDFQGGLNGAG